MSCREVEEEAPLESGSNVCNVVQLQPAGGSGARGSANAAGGAPALDAMPFQPDAITRDGLELLKAFFAIDDAATRAALVLLAQRIAGESAKR
jgi:hypothetical protein